MQKRSLGQTLTRQWMLFAIILSLLFASMCLLALYILEDHFLDGKLRSVDRTVHTVETHSLPAGFALFTETNMPADLRTKFAGRSDGAHDEFLRGNGRYVHALRARSAAGERFLLVYDVTDEMTVNKALARYWLYALLLVLLFALLARLLARMFMMRWSDSASRLVHHIRDSQSPQALRDYAMQEPVQEFAELARHNADAWQDKLDALNRERELLAFLAHELRTPLQTARATLAVLEPNHSANAAWSRLARAIKRLERVSHSIRWLAPEAENADSGASSQNREQQKTALKDRNEPIIPPLAISPLLEELLSEFQPLADRKGVTLTVQGSDTPHWRVPAEVAETLLANLLLNALQHGDNSPICITREDNALSIRNGMVADTSIHSASDSDANAGLGLVIVQRWAARFGLQITQSSDTANHYTVRISQPADTQL